MSIKPLGRKSYGSIGHIIGSRMGLGDHHCPVGQEKIATIKVKHKHQRIYIQEKLDGSNVGVALVHDKIIPITRSGYIANTSPYVQHHYFYDWVMDNTDRFREVLKEGERLCGEWLLKAHGTIYELTHEPFIAFDIMEQSNRLMTADFIQRIDSKFKTPSQISGPLSIKEAFDHFGVYGHHGAKEHIEGFVWRCENVQTNKVEFLCKYVRPEKEDGKYFTKKNDVEIDIWNHGEPITRIIKLYGEV